MKKIYIYLFTLLFIKQVYAQNPFNSSGHCMVNANDPAGNVHQLERRATFKYYPIAGTGDRGGTGTLINQATHNGENPRQLFYTSWHCLKTANFNFYQPLNYF